MIRNYQSSDSAALLALWNTAGVKLGFALQNEENFSCLLLSHPNFSPDYTFVLEEEGKVQGFINGCTGLDIPKGDIRGYVSCLILAEQADNESNTHLLLAALEEAFRNAAEPIARSRFSIPFAFRG